MIKLISEFRPKQKNMKKVIFVIILLVVSLCGMSQTYISIEPAFTNTAGTLADKANISIEAGRQWDVFSLGIDVGKTTLAPVHGRDTSVYFEVRPNLNIFQQGKFTNTLTPGIGFIFNAKENLMTEITSGIEYAYSPLIHFNIFFGQYFYSGKASSSNVTFFGLSVMKYFKAFKGKGILNKP